MRFAVIRERKKEGDSRSPLTPKQVAFLRNELDLDIVVEASPNRCFNDNEYADQNVPVVRDVTDCDILLGIKEVPIEYLIEGKTYLIFSHTIKKQEYNKPLLQSVLDKGIRLIDYELLTNTHGHRIIAFGHFAGMVGTHNALWAWGKRTGMFSLPRMKDCINYDEAKDIYSKTTFPAIKIVLTGTGKVGTGALFTLQDMGIRQVSPEDFLNFEYDEPVFAQLLPHHYVAPIDGSQFDKANFYNDPSAFKSTFSEFTEHADIMINGIYWVSDAPAFFTSSEVKNEDFRLRVIADISCDIAPISSIPTTLRASSIQDPIFGVDRLTGEETPPFLSSSIDMMTIDNLPNELPREASKTFGKQFITRVMGELMKSVESDMIKQATICRDGHLTRGFEYLKDWVEN